MMTKRDEMEGLASGLERALLVNDLSKLSAVHRLEFYNAQAHAAGLEPASKPFDFMEQGGRISLYLNAGGADQLATKRRLSVDILSRERTDGGLYEVLVRCREGERTTDNLGIVFLGDAKGEELANRMMKAITKGRRRAIKAHCGLGMPDETEIDSIPGARRIRVDHDTGEVMGELPAPGPDRFRRAFFGLWAKDRPEGETVEECAQAMRDWLSEALNREVVTRASVTPDEWESCLELLKRVGAESEEAAPAAEPAPTEQPSLDSLVCADCGVPLTNGQHLVSMRGFGRPLCPTDQRRQSRGPTAPEEKTYAQQTGL